MRALWLGIGVATTLVACGDDTTGTGGSGGSGGSAPSTSSGEPSTSSSTSSTSSSTSGSPDASSGTTTGEGGGGGDGGGDGGAGGNGDGGGGYLPPEGGVEACEAYWQAYVDLALECWGGSGEAFYGGDDVVERLASNCADLIYRGGLEVAAQETCNVSLEAIATCDDFDAFNNSLSEACLATFVGETPDGGNCLTAYECESQVCYITEPGSTCGTCLPSVGRGEACDDVETFCTIDVYCIDGTCDDLPGDGEPCDATYGCAVGTWCIEDECVRDVDPGDPCEPQEDFSLDLCSNGHLCDPDAEVCTAFTMAEVDEPCGLLETGYTGCTDANRCLLDDLENVTGSCVLPLENGEACNTDAPLLYGTACTEPVGCIDGICTRTADYFSCE